MIEECCARSFTQEACNLHWLADSSSALHPADGSRLCAHLAKPSCVLQAIATYLAVSRSAAVLSWANCSAGRTPWGSLPPKYRRPAAAATPRQDKQQKDMSGARHQTCQDMKLDLTQVQFIGSPSSAAKPTALSRQNNRGYSIPASQRNHAMPTPCKAGDCTPVNAMQTQPQPHQQVTRSHRWAAPAQSLCHRPPAACAQ
jgi:hypothetical protein